VSNLELTEPSAAAAVPPRATTAALVRDLVSLTKPRITLLVILTGAAGKWLAPGHLGPRALWLSLVGTALIVSSANALNMWWERDLDGKMARTRNRPLPAGRLSPQVALVFGLALGAVSLPLLLAVNLATAALGLLALVLYVVVYTPMKRFTWLALLVGAVPGAMPPLMGWTTVTGHVQVGGLLLFGVLFLWQVPHFAAITLFRANDYARAGMQVLAVQRGRRATKHVIVGYTVLLVTNTLLLFPFQLAGERYLAVAAVSGAVFLAMGVRGLTAKAGRDAKWAKQLFAYSILYLVVLIASMLLDRVVV
jgi:protoheme IX farnesyltransferase